METLIAKLNELVKHPYFKDPVNPNQLLTSMELPSDVEDLVDDIAAKADLVLIFNTGASNVFNITTLEQQGFKVKPGEVDSFGWLSGIIVTKVGNIVYG